MSAALANSLAERLEGIEIRVRGRVQGVGFRPAVWRHARGFGLDGDVRNDGEGVLIRVRGSAAAVEMFLDALSRAPPPLAEIAALETTPCRDDIELGFRIVESERSAARTEVSPDAAICRQCAEEVLDPFARRFRYPFTNCTHCGPRLSIVRGVPYDRANTTMAPFPLCHDCAAEYGDPSDRRFHAEPIACHVCGPRARLIRFDGAPIYERHPLRDDVGAALDLIETGEIVAVKALGGYQLACDATQTDVVARLRALKRRDAKPFALMARDLDMIRRYATVDALAEEALVSQEAPIVLLPADGPEPLPEAIAPGLDTLGFMLPSTPLHILLLERMARPVVMTSGNLSDEPQVIGDREAAEKLAPIAPYALVHDRTIANRVDDSVVRPMGGKVRVVRRARGYAPASIALPEGFEGAPDLLAYGPELKATFCLLKNGRAVLSQHQGDLEDAETFEDYEKNLALYRDLFDHAPRALACDMHPEYLSKKLAKKRAEAEALPLIEVQHHHAHLAACLAENGWPLDAPPVLGIALDGLGYGDDGTIWGGEFLLGGYRSYERLATFKPVAMPGGAQASREPWRNLYAHLAAEIGWAHVAADFGQLDVIRMLSEKPRATLDAMIANDINAPRASSCGRLFDAVAAVLGVCFERQAYEGEAAARLEAAVRHKTLADEGEERAYPLSIRNLKEPELPCLEPLALWRAIFGDLALGTPVPVMAARFHKGLARAVAAMAAELAEGGAGFDTVALSGGCFQNRVLFEQTLRRLEANGFKVLTHARVPANDGGVALGQAAVAAARLIEAGTARQKGS
jgi:hydrogenase maturation protein HypF